MRAAPFLCRRLSLLTAHYSLLTRYRKANVVTEDRKLEGDLKKLIVERLFLKVAPDDIADNDPLMDTYGIDSVQLFEIVVGLEEAYGITMEDEEFDLALFANVKSIADFVRRKQAAAGPPDEASAEAGS